MRLHLHGGMLGAAEFGIGTDIEIADALAAGYRIHQADDERGFIHGTPMMRCKWSAWVGSPVVPRPEISETEIEALRRTVGGVLFNVSNFPDKAQARLLGQDMRPLNDRLTSAIIESWLPSMVARARKEALREAVRWAERTYVNPDGNACSAAWAGGVDAVIRNLRALAEGKTDD